MSTTVNSSDTVLGYTLTHKLGAGGYGEVWAAEAPGGLVKAVKLVYGYHDESRAQRELKALNHIKQLRHPFLLSLERIEVANGQLVIVSELADKCLKTRFDECVHEGMPGIPREELLKYLRDTAEALDFLGSDHGLQHLDIKPENLLILGGHIKVADFGLVKNLDDCTQSLMGGLTPTFSAPELFEGKPARTSDQYSLAIVFQEMLLGKRPFTGTTAAELAAQHTHGRPDVSDLPRGDQSVVLKALSKQPSHRFASCTEFVEELASRKGQLRPRKRSGQSRPGRRDSSNPDVTQFISNSKLPVVASDLRPRSLDRLAVDETAACVRPTLFIGVGRTGSQVVRELRSKLFCRFGDYQQIPSLRVLCIDADQDEITGLSVGEKHQSLGLSETLEIPLRSPEAYRKDANIQLPWLSRRWLFNIPRSRKTEGVRALGRLAFADHCTRIHERLHELVLEITDEESLAKTAQTIGLPAIEEPRVVVVASTSGGTGGGIAADIGYAVRAALLQNGKPDDQVIGVLAHVGGRTSVERKLATANTYALLRELAHFAQAGSFPGDESCELPEFHDGKPTFSHTYYLDLGCDVSEPEWDKLLDSLSEYLYLDAATSAGGFFELARSEDEDEPGDSLALRSLSLQRLEIDYQLARHQIVGELRGQLLGQWSGQEHPPEDLNANAFADKAMVNLHLSAANNVSRAKEMASAIIGGDQSEQLLKSVTDAIEAADSPASQQPGVITGAVDKALPAPEGGQVVSEQSGFHVAMGTQVKRWVETTTEELRKRILQLVDQPKHRVGGAQTVLRACLHRMTTTHAEIEKSIKKYEQVVKNSEQQLCSASDWGSAEHLNQVSKYTRIRNMVFLLQWADRMAGDLIREWLDVDAELQRMSDDLHGLIGRHKTPDWEPELTPKGQFEIGVIRALMAQLDELTKEVENTLETSQFGGNGSLSQLLRPDGLGKKEFSRMLTTAADKVTLQAFSQLDIDRIIRDSGTSEEALTQWVYHCLANAKNGLIQCGGEFRLLMALPAAEKATLLGILVEKGFGESPTMLSATSGDVIFCLEARDLRLQNLAVNLVEQCPEAVELVPRVTSRNDIEWQVLTGLG